MLMGVDVIDKAAEGLQEHHQGGQPKHHKALGGKVVRLVVDVEMDGQSIGQLIPQGKAQKNGGQAHKCGDKEYLPSYKLHDFFPPRA